MSVKTDYLIIGAGIIGTTIARELALRKAGRVSVLEKEISVGCHASGHNSGVIHSGINQKAGSLKARMCVEGSRRLREYCKRRNVPMMESGTLVLGRDDKELATLEKLLQMGRECGVEGLKILTAAELKEREPIAKGRAALLSPSGASVDSLRLIESLAQDAREAGVEFHFRAEAVRIEGQNVFTQTGDCFETGYLINAAGLYADRMAWLCGIGREYRVIPFRGEYMEVKNCDVRSMIYQPPDLRFPFLSIHLTREADGKVLAGPSAVPAFGREAYDKQWVWKEMGEILLSRQFRRLVMNPDFLKLAFENAMTSLFRRAFIKQVKGIAEGLSPSQFYPYRAGIRAQLVDASGKMVNDLLIKTGERSLHVLNAVSPGMTCSLAFAGYVADQILGAGDTRHAK